MNPAASALSGIRPEASERLQECSSSTGMEGAPHPAAETFNRIASMVAFCLAVFCCGNPMSQTGTQATTVEFSRDAATAAFAGGCFWCMQPPFEKIPGVTKVVAGYTGGTKKNPTYEEVSSGGTGHMESIQVTYDPRRTSYLKLLDVFWKSMDPTDAGGQFVDRGNQYRSAIFYHTLEQRAQALATKSSLAHSGVLGKREIATLIVPASVFYEAEAYHQDYYKKNPADYHRYRSGSGRDQFLERTWKDVSWSADTVSVDTFSKPEESVIRKILTPLAYRVTQEGGTEPSFSNEYWNNHAQGIYVDVVTGEPLFSSLDKFESGTGWPSFTRPLVDGNVVEKDHSAIARGGTEVHSRHGGSHLGDLFDDGPPPGHLRYCIDSAALRFIPKEDLQREGYGRFRAAFGK